MVVVPTTQYYMKPLILIVDSRENADALTNSLKGYYQVGWVDSGQKVQPYMARKTPDLILLGGALAGLRDGGGLCRDLIKNNGNGEIPVLLTIENRNEITTAYSAGAEGALQKPFLDEEVLARVNLHVSATQNKRALRRYNETLEVKVRDRTRELETSQRAAIYMLGAAGHYNDTDTGVHIWRMASYSVALAQAVGWDENGREVLKLAAPMHDTGKIGIPDKILKKPGKLDPEEWKIMKTHSSIGHEILSKSKAPVFSMAAEIALCHHEKWDGSGYPKGYSGEAIPESARIVAVADVFDALTMKRPYKDPWPVEKAVEEIKKLSGGHLESRLTDHFMSIMHQILAIKDRFRNKDE